MTKTLWFRLDPNEPFTEVIATVGDQTIEDSVTTRHLTRDLIKMFQADFYNKEVD